MIDNIQIIQAYKSTTGDSVSFYEAKFVENPTLEEFVKWIITKNPHDWGTVHLGKVFGPPVIEYRWGMVTKYCEDYEDLKQKTISLDMKFGGWTMMDYVIKFL